MSKLEELSLFSESEKPNYIPLLSSVAPKLLLLTKSPTAIRKSDLSQSSPHDSPLTQSGGAAIISSGFPDSSLATVGQGHLHPAMASTQSGPNIYKLEV